MFVAPLNFDLMFKKVFSDKEIARSFLQDLLGVKITKIRVLGIEYKVTNDAVIVKFDYRCRINGEFVVIEMQQRYKKDVVKRFYMYHCVSTTLQLEMLKPVTLTKSNGESYKEKDYSGVEPVLTIVWMVDDNLKFKEDVIVFSTLPEATKDFITDDTLWSQPLETILEARDKTLKILNNKTKGLDFLQKNKIIYFFQANIAKNKHIKPYSKWGIFGEKSKDPNNVESDFEAFKKDKIMAEVIRRLEITRLDPSESVYVSDLFQYENMLEQKKDEVTRMQQKMERVQHKADQAQHKADQAQQETAREKERADKAEKDKQEKLEMVSNAVQGFLALGKDIPYIAGVLGLTVDETSQFAQQN